MEPNSPQPTDETSDQPTEQAQEDQSTENEREIVDQEAEVDEEPQPVDALPVDANPLGTARSEEQTQDAEVNNDPAQPHETNSEVQSVEPPAPHVQDQTDPNTQWVDGNENA